MVEARKAVHPGLAQQRRVDREGERAQPRIRADIAGRLLAADVLLASRQRQYPAAAAFGVGGLADQPARHLPHMLLTRGEKADMRPAEIERVAERLAFGGDD